MYILVQQLDCTLAASLNESTEVQTLGAIRIQLYRQCFEQV